MDNLLNQFQAIQEKRITRIDKIMEDIQIEIDGLRIILNDPSFSLDEVSKASIRLKEIENKLTYF